MDVLLILFSAVALPREIISVLFPRGNREACSQQPLPAPPPPLLPRNTIGDMDLAFSLPCLHERMPLAGNPPVRGRGAADAGHALGSSGGAPGELSVVVARPGSLSDACRQTIFCAGAVVFCLQ